jgi:hypothetical protein
MACFVGLMRGGPPRRHPMSTDSKIDLDLRAVEISAGDLRQLRDRRRPTSAPDRAPALFQARRGGVRAASKVSRAGSTSQLLLVLGW